MNVIDISVVGLFVFFGILGIVRGMVRQLFSLGGLVAGHLLGIQYCAFVAFLLKLQFKYSELVGYLIILLVTYIIVFLLGCFIKDKVHGVKLSFLDRVLGLLAGLLKGGLLAVLLVFVLTIVLPKDAKVLRESITAPHAIVAGKWLAKGFPAHISDYLHEKVRAAEKRPPGSLFKRN